MLSPQSLSVDMFFERDDEEKLFLLSQIKQAVDPKKPCRISITVQQNSIARKFTMNGSTAAFLQLSEMTQKRILVQKLSMLQQGILDCDFCRMSVFMVETAEPPEDLSAIRSSFRTSPQYTIFFILCSALLSVYQKSGGRKSAYKERSF